LQRTSRRCTGRDRAGIDIALAGKATAFLPMWLDCESERVKRDNSHQNDEETPCPRQFHESSKVPALRAKGYRDLIVCGVISQRFGAIFAAGDGFPCDHSNSWAQHGQMPTSAVPQRNLFEESASTGAPSSSEAASSIHSTPGAHLPRCQVRHNYDLPTDQLLRLIVLGNPRKDLPLPYPSYFEPQQFVTLGTRSATRI